MNKNILILSGSPRKGGNSDILCDEFKRGAEEAGNTVEKIFIRERKVGYCLACGGCFGSGKCVVKDDMAGIIEKMLGADVIVLASPVYFYSIDAQLKTVIDRTFCCWTKLADKEMYYIMTCADKEKEAMDVTLECFRGFARCLPNASEKGIIYGTGVFMPGDVKKTPHMQSAYEMGKAV